jgi:hypothetical protein
MEIINERREINLNKWMGKAKDSHGSLDWAARVLEASARIV